MAVGRIRLRGRDESASELTIVPRSVSTVISALSGADASVNVSMVVPSASSGAAGGAKPIENRLPGTTSIDLSVIVRYDVDSVRKTRSSVVSGTFRMNDT